MRDRSPRPVSVSTVLFDGHPMERAFDVVAAAGARRVEPAFIRGYVEFEEADLSSSGASALCRLAAAAGLEIDAVSAHMDLAGEGAADALARRIEFAAASGAGVLVTNAGPADRGERIRRVVEAALPRCAAAGVTLALENPGHGSGDLAGSGREAARFVRDLGSPHLRLNYDMGNVVTYSHGATRPARDLPGALDAVARLHLKDVVEDEGGWRFCAIGEGMVDIRSVWSQVPRGLPVGLELPLRLSRPGGRDPVRAGAPLPVEALRSALVRSLSAVEALDAGA